MLGCFSPVRLFATLWTVAYQAPLSTGFSRQEYWSGLPFTPPGVLPDSGIEPTYPTAPAVQANSLPLSHWGSPTHTHTHTHTHVAVVQSLSCAQLFATSWTVARQASPSSTISQSLLKFMSIELVMPSNHAYGTHF